MLRQAGGGQAQNILTAPQLSLLTAYDIASSSSSLRNAAMDLSPFSIAVGDHDYVPRALSNDIGAVQSISSGENVLADPEFAWGSEAWATMGAAAITG